jgi:DNA-binding NtrC family response regulator
MKPLVLLVDDEPSTLLGYRKFLEKSGYETEEAETLDDARKAVEGRRFDAILLDKFLPDGNGLEWIPELRAGHPEMAIVVITGAGDVPEAVDSLRNGADNFLTKPVNMNELEVFLKKSLEVGGLRRRNLSHSRLTRKQEVFFGSSRSARETRELAGLAAENESPVLIHGETGVGKGVLARWIHENSSRSQENFVEVNCSSLRGDLLASELFGHAKGAFTSAVSDREGLVEVADRGTLFLDEIGDMDLAVQAQFLKVIEERSYRRVGETRVRQSDFRLVCATNRDLQADIESGRFRPDLFFRINVLPISAGPLRGQTDDIPGLVSHFLAASGQHVDVSSDVLGLLTSYSWPGNARELKNVLERAGILARGSALGAEHFPGIGPDSAPKSAGKGTPAIKSLDEMEEEYINGVVEDLGGDIQRAAEVLGISRSTLYRKMKRLKGE